MVFSNNKSQEDEAKTQFKMMDVTYIENVVDWQQIELKGN